ncbi:hypothetical protein GCM10009608_86500 [Pseudonocardia alaniniphila]
MRALRRPAPSAIVRGVPRIAVDLVASVQPPPAPGESPAAGDLRRVPQPSLPTAAELEAVL